MACDYALDAAAERLWDVSLDLLAKAGKALSDLQHRLDGASGGGRDRPGYGALGAGSGSDEPSVWTPWSVCRGSRSGPSKSLGGSGTSRSAGPSSG